jgi:hypothetical protein
MNDSQIEALQETADFFQKVYSETLFAVNRGEKPYAVLAAVGESLRVARQALYDAQAKARRAELTERGYTERGIATVYCSRCKQEFSVSQNGIEYHEARWHRL